MFELITSEAIRLWQSYPMFYVAFLAFIVATLTLIFNSKSTKIKNSLDFESTYKHNPTIKDSSDHVLKMIRSNTPRTLIEKMFELASEEDRTNSKSSYVHVNDFLNEWERCANGVFHKVYDEHFLYGTYATTLIGAFHSTLPFILIRQEIREKVYVKLTWLALKWHIRRLEEQGKPTNHLLTHSLKLIERHHKLTYRHGLKNIPLKIAQFFESTFFGEPKSNQLLKEARRSLTLYFISIYPKNR